MQQFIIENWYMVIAFLCVGAVIGMLVYRFIMLPNAKKLEEFKFVLESLVAQAEEVIGSGKGDEKLQWVYEQIKKRFPIIVLFMSDVEFKAFVDQALINVGIWLKK